VRAAELSGVVPILPTPLHPDGEVDEAGVRHLVAFCAGKGLDGAVVLGSNGEFPYLSFDEKRRVMGAAAEAAGGRIPVIGTASAYGTDEAVELARAAKASGCTAALAVLPQYFAVAREGVLRHYETVAREGGLPILYYHFPEVSGLSLPPREIARIGAVDGVVGAKITVANAPFLRCVIRATRARRWGVFTGLSLLLEPCLAAGGAGAFCPLPLLAPDAVRGLAEACRAGDRERARALQRDLLRALPLLSGMQAPAGAQALGFRILSRAPVPIGPRRAPPTHALLKEALRLQGHPVGSAVRPPHAAASEAQSALVARTLRELGWLPAA